ncbi:MAG: amino acid ABC transporter permease [Pseudomonadota bacterium]
MTTSAEVLVQTLQAISQTIWVTVALTLGAFFVSLVAGSLSVMLQLGGGPVGAFVSRTYVSLMRGTPLIVQLFVVFFCLPMIGIKLPPLLAAILAIGLNSGAYSTEILRGAILAIPHGQIEAARCTGLAPLMIWRRIILPQAMVTSLPMLVAEASIVLKSTPLASVISVQEMTFAGVLIQARTFTALEVFVPIACAYIFLYQLISWAARDLDRRLAPQRG